MGLDMYAYTTKEKIPPVDFKLPEDAEDIAYWRKHPNLHGWMHALYIERGGTDRYFHCNSVVLTANDIDALERVVLADALPHTVGYFFGESCPEDKIDDLTFIAAARRAVAEGYQVCYTAWF